MEFLRGLYQEFKAALNHKKEANNLKQQVKVEYDTICNLLPYRFYDEDCKLYYNENSCGFILEVPPLCGADDNTIQILTGMITDGIPEGCTIQFSNYASPNINRILSRWQNFRGNAAPIYKNIAAKRVSYYQNANWNSLIKNSEVLIRNFRLFITVSLPYNKNCQQQLKTLKSQLTSTVKSIGADSKELEPEEFLNFIDELIHPSLENRGKDITWDRLNLLSDHFKDSSTSLKVNKKELVFNNGTDSTEVRSYSVKSFPELWAQFMNSDLIGDFNSDYLQIPCPFVTTFTVYFPNEENESAKATRSYFNAIRKSSSGLGRFLPELYEQERDLKFVVDKLKNGQKLVKAYYGITLYAKNGEIEKCERALKSLYKAKTWEIVQNDYVHLPSWLASLPFTFSEGLVDDFSDLRRLKSMVTWSCANLAPLQGEWKGEGDPLTMLIGRKGQIMFWNPFDNKSGNYNVAVIGKSGSGKSMLMQELVTSLRSINARVFVIDDGRSFMNSCRIQGGQFVDFDGRTKFSLNPFLFISAEQFEKDANINANSTKNETYKEEVVNMIQAIIALMCKGSDELDRVEQSYLIQAIESVWTLKRNLATVTDIAEFLLGHQDVRAKDLGIMMQPFTKNGIYGYLFHGENPISLDNPYTVFELSDLQNRKNLQVVVFYVLMFMITEMMFKSSREFKCSLVVDEAWSMLENLKGGGFIAGIARRARKYEGNLITGTQKAQDYFQNEAAKAAYDNSDFKLILSQLPESIEAMKEDKKLSMDELKHNALKSLKMVDNQYSEIMINTPNGYAIGRLILDPYSVALYSSKGSDFARIQNLLASGANLEQAIEDVASTIESKRLAA